ncbi:hypothetical protein [Blastococcus sp. SYSU DS1021]
MAEHSDADATAKTGEPVDDAQELVVTVSADGGVTITAAGEAVDPQPAGDVVLAGGSLAFDLRRLAAPPVAVLHDPLRAAGWLSSVYGHAVAQAAWHTPAGDRAVRPYAPGPLAAILARHGLLRWLTAVATHLDHRALAAETAVLLHGLDGVHDDPDAAADLTPAAARLVDDLLDRLDRRDADPRLTPFRSLLIEATHLRPADPGEDPSLGDPMPADDPGPAPAPPEDAHRGVGRGDPALLAAVLPTGTTFEWAATADRLWVSVPAARGREAGRRVTAAGGLHARAYMPGLSFPVAFVPLTLHGDAFVGAGPLLPLGDPAQCEVDLVSGHHVAPPGAATPEEELADRPARALLDERLEAARRPPSDAADPARPTLAEALAALEQEESTAEGFAAELSDDAVLAGTLSAWSFALDLAAAGRPGARATPGATQERDVEDPSLVAALLGRAPAPAEQVPTVQTTVEPQDDGLRLTVRIAGVQAPEPPELLADLTWPGGTTSVALVLDRTGLAPMLVGQALLPGTLPENRLDITIRRQPPA